MSPTPQAHPAAHPLVRFTGVQKTYDGLSLVVKSLDLDIQRGEFLSLLGPSGSGKTTTLMMLAGLRVAHGGRHSCSMARQITSTPPHKRNFGMVSPKLRAVPAHDRGRTTWPTRSRCAKCRKDEQSHPRGQARPGNGAA